MGGYNSGRHGGRPVVEDGLTIDLARMIRKGWIRDGAMGSGELRWSRNGEPFASIGHWYDLTDTGTATLTLNYTWTPYGGAPQRVEQRITLTSTRPNYGGRRWWFVCPFTGDRAGKLHKPNGGGKFASRKAWRLAYRSQRSAHRDRPFDKLFRLQNKLGTEQGWGNWLPRPKGMHHRTYERHLARFEKLEAQCDAAMMGLANRLRGLRA